MNDAVASIGPRLTQTERKKKLRQKITSAKCAVQGVGPKHLNPGESRTAKLQTLDITQVHKYECNVDVRDLYPWKSMVGLAKRDFEFNSNESTRILGCSWNGAELTREIKTSRTWRAEQTNTDTTRATTLIKNLAYRFKQRLRLRHDRLTRHNRHSALACTERAHSLTFQAHSKPQLPEADTERTQTILNRNNTMPH